MKVRSGSIYIFSGLLWLIPFFAEAQIRQMERMQQLGGSGSTQEDTSQYVPKVRDTTPKFVFQGIMVGYDVFGGVRDLIKPNLTSPEITAFVDLKRILLAADYGRYSHTIDSLDRFLYRVSGHFFRVGVDANILYKDPDHNVFSFGLRYGRAKFDDYMLFDYPTSDSTAYKGLSAENKGLSANWLEMNMGMKVQIWKFFWMGYHARFKFRPRYTSDSLIPFEIPGYGRSQNVGSGNSTWGFNYYFLLRIPLTFGK